MYQLAISGAAVLGWPHTSGSWHCLQALHGGPTAWYLLGSSQHGAWELRARVPKEGDKQKSDPFIIQPWSGVGGALNI